MSDRSRLEETRRWLRYAQEDLLAAEVMLESAKVLPRHVCWLAPQAAKKAIKTVLVFLQIDLPALTI